MRYDRIAVILNKGSGTLQQLGADAVEQRIREGLRGLSGVVAIRTVEGSELPEVVKEESGRAGTLLLVGGGDGTITTAIRNARGECAAMAFLPLGTMNLFTGDLGMDADLDECLRQLAEGTQRQIDLAEVNGLVYTTNAHLGVYPLVGHERERRRGQPLWKKWPGLLWQGLRALWRYPLLSVRIVDAEGRQQIYRTRMVTVSNNVYDTARPGAWPVRSRLDRGELAVYILDYRSRLRLIFGLSSLITGAWTENPHVRLLRTSEVTIDTSRRHRRLLIDGESLKMTPPLHFRCLPGALKVLAPPAGKGADKRTPEAVAQ